MPAAAISAISPTGSTTSTRPASKLMDAGVTINRPPRDGYMAFVKSPDNISIELLQRGEPQARRRSPGPPCPIPAPGRLKLRLGWPDVGRPLAKRSCSAILPGSP